MTDPAALRERLKRAVHRATPWATTAEVPSDDIANEVLREFGLDDLMTAEQEMREALTKIAALKEEVLPGPTTFQRVFGVLVLFEQAIFLAEKALSCPDRLKEEEHGLQEQLDDTGRGPSTPGLSTCTRCGGTGRKDGTTRRNGVVCPDCGGAGCSPRPERRRLQRDRGHLSLRPDPRDRDRRDPGCRVRSHLRLVRPRRHVGDA
jgi:hypothetical protein